jgi:hypothetical protein
VFVSCHPSGHVPYSECLWRFRGSNPPIILLRLNCMQQGYPHSLRHERHHHRWGSEVREVREVRPWLLFTTVWLKRLFFSLGLDHASRATTDPICYQSASLAPGIRVFRTSSGSQWTVALPDGTTVSINMYFWGSFFLVSTVGPDSGLMGREGSGLS